MPHSGNPGMVHPQSGASEEFLTLLSTFPGLWQSHTPLFQPHGGFPRPVVSAPPLQRHRHEGWRVKQFYKQRRLDKLGPREPQSGAAPPAANPRALGMPTGKPQGRVANTAGSLEDQSGRITRQWLDGDRPRWEFPCAPCWWRWSRLLSSRGNRTYLSPKILNAHVLRGEKEETESGREGDSAKAAPGSPWRRSLACADPEVPRGEAGAGSSISGWPICDVPSAARAPAFYSGIGSHAGWLSTWIGRCLTMWETVHPPAHTKKAATGWFPLHVAPHLWVYNKSQGRMWCSVWNVSQPFFWLPTFHKGITYNI